MPAEQQGLMQCKTCLEVTLHDTVSPVSRGQTYVRCRICGSIVHFPNQEEREDPSATP